ncbi:hypothetical protein A9Q84_09045 [Halobacteriovorax marinus]|uniref:Secreted protein n=1 Tax=Halobacteriovorax marinus TaxID=97084 RepID=A0A1Y5F6W5_9BACT|nr:hypothetical protein A9Q84_09045 [Halobacteriovorax marinus]
MKILCLLAVLTSIVFATTQTSTQLTDSVRKQRPFNDEGPECKRNCPTDETSEIDERLIIVPIIGDSPAPKPPFNDEGPGGKT